jgi:tRNA(Ile)-lysidine synthase
MNLDLGFTRNRVRHVLIPTLTSEFNPNLIETLAKTVEILTDEDKWMRTITHQWLREHGKEEEDTFVIQSEKLRSSPRGLARRVIRSGLRQLGSELRDVSFEHIEAVRRLLEPGKSGRFVEIPGGLEAAREFDRLVFRRVAGVRPDYEYELQIPGHVHIPELGKIFRAEIIQDKRNLPNAGSVFVDAGSIGPCVRIRNWKPGDYYRPVGLPAGKLKKLFRRARIPRSHRIGWPVVVADSTIVWVASFPVSREFAPGGNTERIVALEALPF